MTDTQDGPIEDGSGDASNDEQLRGIVEQVRHDVASGRSHDTVLEELRQRTGETGIEVSDERLRQIAADIAEGR
ncbi:hypothetical protein OH146_10475 [Salinibacterium sp. SYSU T00001]|uniref:hypothetical protein n=1 Tax=Homoserinimonas sedimenticola TaxID=2986805 RepID=UPI002236BE7E|nr:hypothetical protein [Salinibacterium sedimenticola]MCW4386195.1 hypothetical protein [Salinibacterium sedimenticola]